MNKLFNNILVPVDFSDASELAIEKAIDIANHFKFNIHLVFAHANPGVKKSRHFVKGITGSSIDAQTRLYQLQNRFTYQLHPGLSFQSCFRKGNPFTGSFYWKVIYNQSSPMKKNTAKRIMICP